MSKPSLFAALIWLALWMPEQLLLAESLEEAWQFARSHNPELAAAGLKHDATYFDLQATRSERLPSASFNSSYTVRSDSPSFRVPAVVPGFDRFAFAQREAAAAQAQIQTPLYTSGRIKNAILGAEANLSSTHHESSATEMDLLLAIGNAYLTVLRTQRECQVAEQNVATLTAHEKEVESLFQQQRVPRNDLLAAQVTTATATQDRLRQQHQHESARAAYNRLLGRVLNTPFQLAELNLPSLPYSFAELEQLAWQRRPELLQLKASADARYFESQRLLATRRPQVSALGRYDFEENRFQTPQAITSAAVVVDWKPFDGGRSKRAAQAEQLRAARLNRLLEDLKSRVSLELLTTWNDRHEATQRREVSLRTLQQADENLRVSQLRYSRGMAVQSEVLDATSRRTQVIRDYHNAAYDVVLAELRLRHAAGILGSPS